MTAAPGILLGAAVFLICYIMIQKARSKKQELAAIKTAKTGKVKKSP